MGGNVTMNSKNLICDASGCNRLVFIIQKKIYNTEYVMFILLQVLFFKIIVVINAR